MFIKTDIKLSKFEDAIIEKVGAKSLVISESSPKVKFSNNSKENVKGKAFELFLNKI